MKDIPVLHVEGKSLAEAYENALVSLYKNGARIKTQYDKKDEPESIDATVNITIHEPLSDPMIHKAFPGGIADLREYVMELQGYKDHWMKNMDDADDTRWEYTYHQRLARYGTWKQRDKPFILGTVKPHKFDDGYTGFFNVNQIDAVIRNLENQPFTRQAQMITWMPNMDTDCYDPPCLQSLWYRMPEDDGVYYLNCNVRFRSNDAWGANFMNMFGFVLFNKELIADEVGRRTGKEVRLGRMNWHADSYHIYGKDIEQAKQRLFDRLDKTSFDERVFNFSDPMIKEMYEEATPLVLEKIKQQQNY
jgi:thymidylate synthase